MPTSSQSKILSVVDYQLIQQENSDRDGGTKSTTGSSIHRTAAADGSKKTHQKDQRRLSIEDKNNDHSPSPNAAARRHNTDKINDGLQSARTSQRNDILHMPVINLNDMAQNQPRSTSSYGSVNDNRQSRIIHNYEQSKSKLLDTSRQLDQQLQNSLYSDNDDQIENNYRSKQIKKYPTPVSADENTSSTSDLDYIDNNNLKNENRASLLNDNARRLLILGTIRPSKTFYKNLSESDVEHLMKYFRRMKTTHRRMTSEEIHEELTTQFVEYKPKIFFDSSSVTKTQVKNIEKIIDQHADTIRNQKAEFVKLDNPMRFVIKPIDNDTPLTTIPREYNDCFITLVSRSDPLRKSDLVSELVQNKLLEDMKTNSLDISYFPGGINYDVPHDDIDENGQMKIETYQKLKKRLNNRRVWYFSEPPEKKPNALLATITSDTFNNINHQRLYDVIHDHLKSLAAQGGSNIENKILSIEFVPLSCILNSNDAQNQFIVDCDDVETKQKLMEKPLKIASNRQLTTIELCSYDESMQKEYEKFLKSEKYRELIKKHDAAVKRLSAKK